MLREQRLSLSGAYQQIVLYLNAHPYGFLPPPISLEDKQQFLQLLSQIKSIEVIERGWLKGGGGLLSKYWLFKNKKVEGAIGPSEFTQEDLLEEAVKTQLDTLNFTYVAVKTLWHDLYDKLGRYYKLVFKHPDVFDKVGLSIKSVLEVINPKWMDENERDKPLPLVSKELELYSGQNGNHLLARLLGARIVPFSQSYDPLRGKIKKNNEIMGFEGDCNTQTIIWCREIIELGHYLSLPRQDSHLSPIGYELDKSSDEEYVRQKEILETENLNFFEIPFLIDQILLKMNDTSVYTIVSSKNNKRRHIIGIRKIKNSHEIEYFDANLGILVFPDAEKFKLWYARLFLAYYYSDPYNAITLLDVGNQPINVKTSIPPIIETKPVQPNLDYACFTFADVNDPTVLFNKLYAKIQTAALVLNLSHENLVHVADYKQRKMITSMNQRIKKFILDKMKLQKEIVSDVCCPVYDKFFHEQLKRKVIQVIRLEREKLASSFTSNEIFLQKQVALNKLIYRIRNAHPCMTLLSIISEWDVDCQKLDFSGGLKKFIHDFTEHAHLENYEINPACIRILQEKFLYQLFSVLNRDYNLIMPIFSLGEKIGNQTYPHTVVLIRNHIISYAKGEMTIQETLKKIKNYCRETPTGMLTRVTHWRAKQVDFLYEIIKNVDENSLLSLTNAYNDLNQCDKEMTEMTIPHHASQWR